MCPISVPLPDMGASKHAYSLTMKALFQRSPTKEGSCMDVSMFQSTVSWLTVPIAQAGSFAKHISRRGNAREFFAPVSVYTAKDRYAYIAADNDIQWDRMLRISGFESPAKPEYIRNEGRITDVGNLNNALEEITGSYDAANELIHAFTEETVPISKVNTIEEVIEDPYAKNEILSSTDTTSGAATYLAPLPVIPDYVKSLNGKLAFPPRFGEHNKDICCSVLGYTQKYLGRLKAKGIA
ncbi:MAG TPA: hypothetical protein DCZ04_08865 [Syntrophorhabdus aromaticivorans]|nr:hypothetical protein [Syntrophorhabdus aromaticivorans]